MTKAEYQILKESFERRLLADPKLSHAHLRVAIAIKWYMNHNTGDAWPGVQRIMKEARVSERTVNRAIKYFTEANHMVVERRPGGVNHYIPQPQSTEDTTDTAMTGGTDTAMTGGTVKAMTPEPSTYPSREPPPYGYHSMIPDTEEIRGREEKEGVCRESKEGEESTPFAQPSCAEGAATGEAVNPDGVPPLVPNEPTWKECYRAASELPDEKYSGSLVTRAWKKGAIVTDIWDKICQAKETGESLARLLWEPGDEC